MNHVKTRWRYVIVLAVLAGVGIAFWWGMGRLQVNSDITAALPKDDKVVVAAQEILRHHPVLDNVFVQISLSGNRADRKALIHAGDLASTMLSESGLVRVVSGVEGAEYFAVLLDTVTENLPFLFSREELRSMVEERLRPAEVERCLEQGFRQLMDLGTIGQARYLPSDPLGIRALFLSRLSMGLPFGEASLEGGHILSKDGRHLLLIAQPRFPSRDTSFSSTMTEVLERISVAVERPSEQDEKAIRVVYAGAFRASLDNERIIRRDTSRSLTFVLLALVPLVLLSFRRPWLGLLSAVPAMMGAMLALLAFAVSGKPIFAVAMGFGGALVGIAVDHGLAFVVLLDRPGGARGERVSRDIWAVGSLSLLSSVAAFLTLTFVGIPLFAQVGVFAALGVSISALFVHFLYPMLFPELKGAKTGKPLIVERLMGWLIGKSSWWTLGACAAFALVMLCFVRIEFSVDLATMNTVSKETLMAEQAFQEVWGGLSARPCIMARGPSPEALWKEVDRLGEFLKGARRSGMVEGDLPRAALFPGPVRQEANLKAWQDFWIPERVMAIEKALRETGARLKFKEDAFDPFLKMLREPGPERMTLPKQILAGLGVFPDAEGSGWVMVDTVVPGPKYEAEAVFEEALRQGFDFFDPGHFSRHLARELNESFVRMLMIIGGVTLILLFLFFLDWQLLLLTVSPVIFSFVATLGTMGIMGLPLSIPSLMLTPLLIGLGLDYGVFFVRCYQRFGTTPHTAFEGFRVSVMLNGVTTLLGFGSLLLSEHVVLRDVGLSTSLGIFYAMVGAFWIGPPALRSVFKPSPGPDYPVEVGSREHRRSALRPFRHLETFPRMFARFKLLLDPMFPRLAGFVRPGMRVIDVGCGYGVPACWLLAVYPDLKFLACDPDEERARIAARVLGEKGEVLPCGAMDLPLAGEKADAALLLDMIHYLSDTELADFLARLRAVLTGQGKVIIRATIPGKGFSLYRFVESTRLRLRGARPCYRGKEELVRMLEHAGLAVELVEPTAPGREETWFLCGKALTVS